MCLEAGRSRRTPAIVGLYKQAREGKAFSTGWYKYVDNPKKAEFNALLRRLEQATSIGALFSLR